MRRFALPKVFSIVLPLVLSGIICQATPAPESVQVRGGFVGGPVPSDSLTLNPFAFDPVDPASRAALRTNGGTRYCEASQCLIAAPVELPYGATIRRFELDAVDWADGSIHASFRRCPVGELGCTPHAILFTSGPDGPGPVHLGLDLTYPVVIDNAQNSYYVSVTIARGSGLSTYSRLTAVRLVFDPSAVTAHPETLSVSPLAFEAYGQFAGDVTGIQRYCLSANCDLTAPVELPSGSVVSQVWLDAYDSGDGKVSLWFERYPTNTTGRDTIASVQTTGSPGLVQVPVAIPPETIDNETFSYAVRADILGPGVDSRLAGARLVFEPPAGQKFFETLAVNPYAFERVEPEDVYVGHIGSERYCADFDCNLYAPVELPSGTVLSRLQLEAYDATSSGKVVAEILRCPTSAPVCYGGIAVVETSGFPGETQVEVDLASPEIIDNSRFTYLVSVLLSGGNSNTRLGGVRLLYTPTWVFNSDFESGSTASWSNTVQ